MRASPVAPAAVAAVLALAGCPAPDPHYDDDIGVQAIPVEAGAHEGTFALKTLNVTLVHVPALGDYEGGGANYRLVHRTYDAENDVYQQRSQLCGGFNFEVAGVTTGSPESTYRDVAESPEETVTIDEGGAYASTGHLQLWGLHDLPDPYTTELPKTREAAAEPPWDERVFDMDGDDNPGITLFVSGIIEGQLYAFQRKTVDLSGVVLGPDRALGLADNTNEALTLGADNPLVDRQDEGTAEPHPDKKKSWFEEVRIADDADCDVVMHAEEDGLLSTIRPF